MTTLHDYLNDFAQEIIEISSDESLPSRQLKQEVEDKIEEYLERIKNRLIN